MESALHCLNTKFTVDLHPSKLSSVETGVREHLHALLLRYNEHLDGVPLSISNEKILTQQAHIHPYFPLVRVDVSADVVLFKPQLGTRLVGTVNKIGADYIGLLVLGFINAAIGAERIRQDLQCRYADSCWVSARNPKHVISVGTQVHFTLAGVQRPGDFVSLIGELRTSDTGAHGFTKGAEKQPQKKQLEDKRQKKRTSEERISTPGGKRNQPNSSMKKLQRSKQLIASAETGTGFTPQANGETQKPNRGKSLAKSAGEGGIAGLVSGDKIRHQQQGASTKSAAAPAPAVGAAGILAKEATGEVSLKKKKGKKRKTERLCQESLCTPSSAAIGSEGKRKKAKKSRTSCT